LPPTFERYSFRIFDAVSLEDKISYAIQFRREW
jgi:hypothetical protein